MSKIIKAIFTGRFCKTQRVFQFDTDDKLQIVNVDLPANFTVDFSNSKTGDSVSVLATSDTVQIPPDLFVPGSEIYAWIWLSDSNGGHTRCEATIPIDPRARRTGTEPTPAQTSAWDEAVDTLNETIEGISAVVDAALTEAKESGEFDGEDGSDGSGVWYVDVQYIRTTGAGVQAQLDHMVGRPGATPAVGDLCVISDGRFGAVTSITPRVAVVPVLGDLSGTDGYSPTVTITEITGGHRITITDEAHPDGQSFDVMDGSGGGSITVDDEISGSSTNPVQNKVIKAALDGKGTYSKPASGIPKTDLAAAVQTSLGKADTALQSAPVTSVNGQTGDVTVTEPLVATYTIDSLPDGNPVSATCDKTFSELATAMYAGTSIVCLVKYGAFPLAITGNVTNDLGSSINASAVFSRDLFGSIVHNSDDTCTVYFGVFADGDIVPGNESPVSGNDVYNALLGKLDIDQGSGNAGKFLVVGSDGNVTTMTLATWQGGNY